KHFGTPHPSFYCPLHISSAASCSPQAQGTTRIVKRDCGSTQRHHLRHRLPIEKSCCLSFRLLHKKLRSTTGVPFNSAPSYREGVSLVVGGERRLSSFYATCFF